MTNSLLIDGAQVLSHMIIQLGRGIILSKSWLAFLSTHIVFKLIRSCIIAGIVKVFYDLVSRSATNDEFSLLRPKAVAIGRGQPIARANILLEAENSGMNGHRSLHAVAMLIACLATDQISIGKSFTSRSDLANQLVDTLL